MKISHLIATFIILFFSASVQAQLICGTNQEDCEGHSERNTSAPAFPSSNSSVHLNPSAVPTEQGLGLEIIYYKSSFDFALVKGLGRVGAAISPSNNEETYFGEPAFESGTDYLNRLKSGDKYNSKKITLATGFSVLDNRGSGLSRFHVGVGVIGKFDRATNHVLPGAGVSVIVGPITAGYAMGEDEYTTGSTTIPADQVVSFATETYSVGLYLTSLALDYSLLKIFAPGTGEYTVSLLTGSLLLKHWILTASTRREDSNRMAYDPSTQTLVAERIKYAMFGGLQYAITKHIMIDVFYNYYLLSEFSFGATLFF